MAAYADQFGPGHNTMAGGPAQVCGRAYQGNPLQGIFVPRWCNDLVPGVRQGVPVQKEREGKDRGIRGEERAGGEGEKIGSPEEIDWTEEDQ